MFKNKYQFYGKHAQMVLELTAVFDETTNAKLFDRNLDVFINAPIIGYLFNRKGEVDKNSSFTKDIFKEQLIPVVTGLEYTYRLIMLLDKENEPDEDKRLDKAFRYFGECEQDKELFNSYVLGGVEILHKKLIEEAKTPSDFINNLYDFVQDFNEKFNDEITNEDIMKITNKGH